MTSGPRAPPTLSEQDSKTTSLGTPRASCDAFTFVFIHQDMLKLVLQAYSVVSAMQTNHREEVPAM